MPQSNIPCAGELMLAVVAVVFYVDLTSRLQLRSLSLLLKVGI